MVESENGAGSALDDVRQLQGMIGDIGLGLANQQELLRVRDMIVPPEMIQEVSSFQQALLRLETNWRDMERETEQLRALVATAALMNSSRGIDTVLTSAMDQVISLTGAERGYILLVNEAGDHLEFRIAREGEGGKTLDGDPKLSSTILNEVMATGKPLLTDNAFSDPRMAASATIAQFSLRSVVCAPLRYKDRTLGVVYVDNRFRSGVFTTRELTLLNAFANQIAVALENARLFARVQATLAEITEMKELIENVFASIGSGIITTTADHRILTFNSASEAILRRAAPDAIGQLLHEVMLTGDDELESLLHAVRDDNQTTMIERSPDVPERGRIVLSIKLSPLKDASLKTQGVTMVLDDLTVEREREQTAAVMRRYLPPGMMDNIQHIAQLALGGERREVTCLFADVCPLSTFPPNLNPPQIMELLNVYLASATEAIHASNGLIDKYMGSEIMVLFNTQLNPQTDHALMALEAAVELRRRLVALYAELGLDPATQFYRVGIHSGVATLGNVGSLKRRNFTAIGDTINLAKRLEENAVRGQIIVSEDVVHYVNVTGTPLSHMRLEERGTIQVKGRQQQTPVYEVYSA